MADFKIYDPLEVKLLSRKKNSILATLRKKKLKTRFKIAILGGSSTEDIKSFLEIFLLMRDIKADFYESDFNSYYEESVFGQGGLYPFKPDIVFIHTSLRNIVIPPLKSEYERDILKKNLVLKFETIWNSIQEKLNCIIIQNNIELPLVRSFGSSDVSNNLGKLNLINEVNAHICNYAKNNSGFYINDINYLSSYHGLENWHHEKSWSMGKYGFNYSLLPYFSFNLFSIIESIYGLKKKVLVLDLDNTLWGGVIGDDGINNIKLGPDDPASESFSRFQEYIKQIQDTGVVLAICSKNDLDNALEGLSHQHSVLKKEDFVSIKANWDRKSSNIIEIAKKLNLGLDSFVFIDDNPAEREEVRQALPEVSVPEIGKDINDYIKIINQCNYFDRLDWSEEDKNRTSLYNENSERTDQISRFADYQEYLESLEMKSTVKEFDIENINRIHSLINKTNQFNLTTKRYTDSEVNIVKDSKDKIGMYGKLNDKFGDNGLIAVIAGSIDYKNSTFIIDMWCMSCRVFKREMEFFFFNKVVDKIKSLNLKTIVGIYIPSKKNKIVKSIYNEIGFIQQETSSEEQIFILDIKNYNFINTKIGEDNDS